MEEERRLCYVALTRAKQTLTLSCARQRMLYGRTTSNRLSRFVDEIPPSCFATRSAPDPKQQPRQKPRLISSRPLSETFSSLLTEMPDFQKGEMVRHKAFGKGMILSVLPMGNDALLEVAFDEVGTKRLMARTASAHMKKLS